MEKDRFEPELKRHLGPVKAPGELWDRVHGSGTATSVRPSRSYARAQSQAWKWVTAAAAVAGLAVGVNVMRHPNLSPEELAVSALGHLDKVTFRSGEAPVVRAWIKSGTGLDVPMPSHLSPTVHLVGANVVQAKVPTAQVSYRVGDMDVTLAVSKADTNSKHTLLRNGSYHGANFVTWSMRGQTYTVAAADARVGCLLCHNGGPPPRL